MRWGIHLYTTTINPIDQYITNKSIDRLKEELNYFLGDLGSLSIFEDEGLNFGEFKELVEKVIKDKSSNDQLESVEE